MPLGNTAALYAWGERENPPFLIWTPIEQWVLNLAVDRFQPPSISWSRKEGKRREIRVADFKDSDLTIFYEVEHASRLVDLFYVGQLTFVSDRLGCFLKLSYIWLQRMLNTCCLSCDAFACDTLVPTPSSRFPVRRNGGRVLPLSRGRCPVPGLKRTGSWLVE